MSVHHAAAATMQGKRQVQEITESLSTNDIVDVSDSLIRRLCVCWDACSVGEGAASSRDAGAMSSLLLHPLECISKLLAQLPSSNTGTYPILSDARTSVACTS